jgi:hypothetical protein
MNKRNDQPTDKVGQADVQADAPQDTPAQQQESSQPERPVQQELGVEQAVAELLGPETGDVRSEARSIRAANTSGTLLTLDDGTPFPRSTKKWLTAAEAERFSRFRVISIQS